MDHVGFIKKIGSFLLLFFMAIGLIGCKDEGSYKNASDVGGKIMEAIINGDVEALKNLYAPYIWEECDGDTQAKELMTLLDSAESFDKAQGNPGTRKENETEVLYETIRGHINQIKLEDKEEFHLIYLGVKTYQNHEDREGIWYIGVYDQSDNLIFELGRTPEFD